MSQSTGGHTLIIQIRLDNSGDAIRYKIDQVTVAEGKIPTAQTHFDCLHCKTRYFISPKIVQLTELDMILDEKQAIELKEEPEFDWLESGSSMEVLSDDGDDEEQDKRQEMHVAYNDHIKEERELNQLESGSSDELPSDDEADICQDIEHEVPQPNAYQQQLDNGKTPEAATLESTASNEREISEKESEKAATCKNFRKRPIVELSNAGVKRKVAKTLKKVQTEDPNALKTPGRTRGRRAFEVASVEVLVEKTKLVEVKDNTEATSKSPESSFDAPSAPISTKKVTKTPKKALLKEKGSLQTSERESPPLVEIEDSINDIPDTQISPKKLSKTPKKLPPPPLSETRRGTSTSAQKTAMMSTVVIEAPQSRRGRPELSRRSRSGLAASKRSRSGSRSRSRSRSGSRRSRLRPRKKETSPVTPAHQSKPPKPSGDASGEFHCSCKAKFSSWNYWLSHKNYHSREKPVCKGCSRDFSSNRYIDRRHACKKTQPKRIRRTVKLPIEHTAKKVRWTLPDGSTVVYKWSGPQGWCRL